MTIHTTDYPRLLALGELRHLSLDELLEIRQALDTTLLAPIAKAVNPVKVTAQVEAQLAADYMKAWRSAAGGALADSFRELVEVGGGELSQARIDSFAARLGVRLKKPLTPRQAKIINGRIRKAYEVSKRATQVQELKVKPSFTLRDTKAINWIAREQVLWIGDFYSAQLSDRIRGVANDIVFNQGFSNREAGRQLRRACERELGVKAGGKTGFAPAVPARYAGEEGVELYYRQLASVASQRARVWSKIEAYSKAGVITYELTNPNDQRTGQICQQMSGQVFSVQTAVEHVDRMMEASTIDEVKAVQPWVQAPAIQTALGGAEKGSAEATEALQRLSAILPPFHPVCRTEPVILSFEQPALEAPPPVTRPKPGRPEPPSPAQRVTLPPRGVLPQPLPKGMADAQLANLTPDEIRHMWGDWSLERLPLATEADVKAAKQALADMRKGIDRATAAIEKLVADQARKDLLLYGDGMLDDLGFKLAGDEITLGKVERYMLAPDKAAQARIDKWPKLYRDDLRRHLPDQAISSMATEGYTIEGVAKSRMRRNVLGSHRRADYESVDGGMRHIRRIRIRKGLPKTVGGDVVAGDQQAHVVVHEFAHGIDRGVLDDAMNRFWQRLEYERVTWYAEISAKEDLAESIAGALVRSDITEKMAKRAPIRTRIVKNMFRDDQAFRRGLVIFSKFGEASYSFDEALAALEAL